MLAPESPQPLAVVCKRVRHTLATSAEFRALPPGRQDKLTRDLVRAAAAAADALARRRAGEPAGSVDPAVAPPANDLVDSVDFPSFVTALIQGTFEAIVDASIQQMSAYTDLLKNVAKSVDEFMHDNVVDEHGCDNHVPGTVKLDGRRLAAHRQQLLATMVLMGINRIVVTKGVIHAGVTYELKPR